MANPSLMQFDPDSLNARDMHQWLIATISPQPFARFSFV